MGFNNTTGVYSPATGAESAAPGQTIASATWNAINTDYSANIRPAGALITTASGIDFNSVADTSLTIPLPPNYTNYIVKNVYISKATQTLTTSKVGLFTAAAGAGFAVVAASTAVTVSATISANSAMNFSIASQFTALRNENPLFFRVTTPQGAAATATVTLEITPVS